MRTHRVALSLRAWCLIAAIAMPAFSFAASNRHYDPTFEITPLAGYRVGGDFSTTTGGPGRELDDAFGYGLVLNLIENEGAYYELLYTKQGSELPGTPSFDIAVEYFHVGGILQGGSPASRVIPYFALTVGGTRLSPDLSGLSSETKFSFGLGGGAKIPLSPNLALRLDVRGFATSFDEDSGLFCPAASTGVGCELRIKSDLLIQVQGSLGVTFGFK